MEISLKRLYFSLLIPAVVGLALVEIGRKIGWRAVDPIKIQSTLSFLPPFTAPMLFTLAALTAIALPILIRTLFAKDHADSSGVSYEAFFQFQQRLIVVSLLTPYLALAAYLLGMERFYVSGTILFSLYAVYYHFPSQKKIAFDQRIFRVLAP